MVGGASKGLGFAVARALALERAHVSMVSRNHDAICAAATRIEKETGVAPLAMPLDLSAPDASARWHTATAQRFGGVDLLFANTGGPPPGSALVVDDEAWRSAFESLVLGTVRLVRVIVPSMQARGGGAILFSTSSAVKEPIPNLAISNVLRASVAALAKTLASELAPMKIRVNTLIPGRIDTDRVRQLDAINGQRAGVTAAEQQQRSAATIPLGRYGTPAEYGAAAAFLLSDAASYITGASMQVDGGLIRSLL